MEGEKDEERAPTPSSLFLLPSSRPRPARAPTPEPLPPLPTKVRILRGARGVNKTHWSLSRKKEEDEGEGEGESEGGGERKEERKEISANPSKSLVLFFGGDEVNAADSHPDVLRLQSPASQAAACSKRYSNESEEEAQIVIALPSRLEAGYACFDHFFSSFGSFPSGGGGLTRSGEPAPPGYSATGLPALSQAASLLRDGGWPSSFSSSGGGGDGSTLDVEELKRMRDGVSLPSSASPSLSSSPWPPTKVVAFSKGGVVANQLLFELSALGHAGFRRRRRRRRGNANAAAAEKLLLLGAAENASEGNTMMSPSSMPHARKPPPSQQQQRPSLLAPLVAALAVSIEEVVFLDAGLNCRGAYGITDPEVARGLALLDSSQESSSEEEEEKRPLPLKVELIGTPRQWGSDRSRAWLLEEKERMFSCLKEAGVCVSSELVLEGRKPDLRTHFLGIEAFGRGGGGGGGG